MIGFKILETVKRYQCRNQEVLVRRIRIRISLQQHIVMFEKIIKMTFHRTNPVVIKTSLIVNNHRILVILKRN